VSDAVCDRRFAEAASTTYLPGQGYYCGDGKDERKDVSTLPAGGEQQRSCQQFDQRQYDQHRHAKLDLTKDTLILSTAPVLTQGRMGGNRLTWKRSMSMLADV